MRLDSTTEHVVCLVRLGGIPVGVICVETRTVEMTIPVDPANLDSETKVSLLNCANTSVYSLRYKVQ